MAKPFYGVEGNLLVADLLLNHAVVEAILDGRFKPTYWAQQMLPDHLFTKYPQLADEHAKRAQRRAYHAELGEASALRPGHCAPGASPAPSGPRPSRALSKPTRERKTRFAEGVRGRTSAREGGINRRA
jgi:hypothetical protein